ncbi:MAG: hypothetical protein KDB02_15530, partial [Acidimicrobiales bacterium]|nr:hypothetical protein [Acidimicrobiales bacterium]
MSLRARVLAAMGAVVALLVVVGVVVNRSTEHHLVAQIDEQLERASLRSTGLLRLARAEEGVDPTGSNAP